MKKEERDIILVELGKACFPGDYTRENTEVFPLSGGLTNRSYLIRRGEDRYVFRLGGDNRADLAIDRNREWQAARRASQAGINAPLEGFSLPEGHMLTRWMDGKEWTREEFNQERVISRCATLLARVHQLEPLTGLFDPYGDIYKRVEICRNRELGLPDNLDKLLAHLERVRKARGQGSWGEGVFCHNDPFYNNFYDAGDRTLLLDWEFAGTGDALFDLASATQVLDGSGKILFYEYYAHSAGRGCPSVRELDEGSELCRFSVMFWNGLWALIQSSHGHIDHDFTQMASNIFAAMEKFL